MNKGSKRILSVTIKHIVDYDPDTSYLGEYSNRAESDYAIDRDHSEDCIENNLIQKAKLERIVNAIENDSPICEEHLDHYDNDCEECLEEKAYSSARLEVQALAECDCGERGDRSGNEYRYFNPSDNYKGESDEDIRKYVRQDYERMERLNRGDWCYIGIAVEAEISVPSGQSHVVSKIGSGGLWGIESDSDKSYFDDIEKEELSQLRHELTALGFNKRAIATAFKNVVRKDS